MRKYLDKATEWLSAAGQWLPKLGFGVEWKVQGVTIKLWPFVAVAIVLALLVLIF